MQRADPQEVGIQDKTCTWNEGIVNLVWRSLSEDSSCDFFRKRKLTRELDKCEYLEQSKIFAKETVVELIST